MKEIMKSEEERENKEERENEEKGRMRGERVRRN